MSLLFLLQEGPAETSSYMVAGYAVVFGVMAIYLFSLYVRRRNLKQDMEVLQELEKGSEQQEVISEKLSVSSER